MAKAEKTAVSKPANTAVATANDDIPAHLRIDGPGKGNENVTAQDLTIPRLGLLQGLSPQLESGNAKFIPGATGGQMFNSLTNELYDVVFLTDIFYRKEYGVFVKRTAGGGFRGSFPSEEDAVTAMETMEGKNDLECIETGVHFCLMLEPIDPDQPLSMTNMKPGSEIVLFMTSTKLKVSRNLNSLIRNRGKVDRWASVWQLVTTKETNKKGTFYNYVVSPAGWVSPEIAQTCAEIYKNIGTRKVDREGVEEEESEDTAAAGSAASKM